MIKTRQRILKIVLHNNVNIKVNNTSSKNKVVVILNFVTYNVKSYIMSILLHLNILTRYVIQMKNLLVITLVHLNNIQYQSTYSVNQLINMNVSIHVKAKYKLQMEFVFTTKIVNNTLMEIMKLTTTTYL